jgi:cytochrome P450
LTPNLGSLISTIEEELQFAIKQEMPSIHEDWKDVSIYDIILHLVARISARVFVGQPTCRNQEWLDTSIRFTEHAFLTLAILRRLPKFLHPVVAPLLPSYWAVHRDLQTAKRIISPIVKQRTADEASGEPGYKKPTDLLQWMIDAASPRDGQPDKLAHRQLVLSLAAIHTTTMAVAYAIYDLCQFPEYVEPLRQEIIDSLEQDGKWAKTTLTKIHKLDSFIKESQRLSPPSLCASILPHISTPFFPS